MEALGINGANLVIQLIAFLVFVGVFWKFALGPITNMLDERQQRIRESMEAAERMEQELAATQSRNEEILAEARREAQQILSTARENSDQTLARAREQAQEQTDQMIAKAEATIASERQQAWNELREQVADLAITAATKIVRQELDRDKHAELIRDTLAEAEQEQPQD
ncbi:MAG: F0F1 ATP synthase subunit B [Thermomicrobiaceae bacterium]